MNEYFFNGRFLESTFWEIFLFLKIYESEVIRVQFSGEFFWCLKLRIFQVFLINEKILIFKFLKRIFWNESFILIIAFLSAFVALIVDFLKDFLKTFTRNSKISWKNFLRDHSNFNLEVLWSIRENQSSIYREPIANCLKELLKRLHKWRANYNCGFLDDFFYRSILNYVNSLQSYKHGFFEILKKKIKFFKLRNGILN